MAAFKIKSLHPATPMPTQDPFLFVAYHRDHYPSGDDQMRAPYRGNGSDFDASKAYRMYHGARIPGFPAHPHRGFEASNIKLHADGYSHSYHIQTITCTIEGIIDHTDSLGGSGRYGDGDLQWMTAGSGIVHSEMIPLLKQNEEGNMTRFLQLWLNLPGKSKMVQPNQLMHWHENITKFTTPDGAVTATVWAGSLHGHTSLPAIRDSWAHDPSRDVNIWFIRMSPRSSFTLPPSQPGSTRSLYVLEGPGLLVDASMPVPPNSLIEFADPSSAETLVKNNGAANTEFLVLQGQPMGEPVSRHGPFVMNTREEVMQAFSDYRTTQFAEASQTATSQQSPSCASVEDIPKGSCDLGAFQAVAAKYEVSTYLPSSCGGLSKPQSFNIVTIADDSGSMSVANPYSVSATRWDELKSTVNHEGNRVQLGQGGGGSMRLHAYCAVLRQALNEKWSGVAQEDRKKLLVLIATDREPTMDKGMDDKQGLRQVLLNE
ncbi:RmlC-like cupin domain-containing protein [Chytriomyces sp. MP71]|nr:RmlC-like cupin domain-containing protein [Chytriomyces sp. MP71]